MNKKLIQLTIVILLVFLNYSCESKTENRLKGLWALEFDSCIVSNKQWVEKVCSNSIVINSKNCALPMLCGQTIEQSKGIWMLLRGKNTPDTLFFNVPNNPLYGKYEISFYKDYNKMKFKMKLQNDSIILICAKNIISFNSHNSKEILDRQ